MTRVNTRLLSPLLRDYLIDYKHVNLNGNFNCIAPDHDDSHPSMNYNSDYNCCHCFACGKTYTLFSLIAEDNNLDIKKDFKLILRKIEELYPSDYKAAITNSQEVSFKTPQKQEKEEVELVDYTKYYDICHSQVDQTDYFQKRGITSEMVEKYNLGYDSKSKMCVFPINANSNFRRSVFGDLKLNSGGNVGCWGEDKLKNSKESDFVIVTESIIDAISLEQINDKYPVISLNGGTRYNKFLEAMKKYDYKGNVVIATDNDSWGFIDAEKIKESLNSYGIKYAFYYPFTHDYKDINEAYLNNPQELIDSFNQLDKAINNIKEKVYNTSSNPKYNKIIQCDLKVYEGYESGYEDKDGMIKGVYLLTYDGCNRDLEVDLCSMGAFNSEYETLNRTDITTISNTDDLINFMENHSINPNSFYIDDNYLYLGAGQDYVLNKNLEVQGWAEEIFNDETREVLEGQEAIR